MNSYKLNGIVGHLARQAIIRGLDIKDTEVYKEVKSINRNGIIEDKNGKKYELILREVKQYKYITVQEASKTL